MSEENVTISTDHGMPAAASPAPDPTETPSAPDPFDPASLRLGTEAMSANLGVTRELITLPVRRPGNDEWVRVHPDESFTLQTGVLELKSDREVYLVARPLWPELADEPAFCCKALFTAMTRQGVCILWPVRLPGVDGKIDAWNSSAMQAALLSRTRWVRMASNMALGAYEVTTASARIAEPVWPSKTLREILSIAFKDRLIDTLDHPVLQRLRGEI